MDAALLILRKLQKDRDLDSSCVDNFMSRLRNNLENIALAKKEWNSDETFKEALYDYLKSEQALMYGHSFHPTPKSKGFLEGEDQISFSPEFGKAIKLSWYQVENSLL